MENNTILHQFCAAGSILRGRLHPYKLDIANVYSMECLLGVMIFWHHAARILKILQALDHVAGCQDNERKFPMVGAGSVSVITDLNRPAPQSLFALSFVTSAPLFDLEPHSDNRAAYLIVTCLGL